MNDMNERSSGIELLRMIAMFMVLVVHADFFSLKCPTITECHETYFPSFIRVFFQSWSCGCVNIFVLISGWFGIKPKITSFASFIFQCAFFLLGIYCFSVFLGNETFSLKGFAANFLFLRDPDYWFIKSYLLLYITAPILNAFVEKAEYRTFKYVLIGFFIFQTFYGWLYPAAAFFQDGYSVISFWGLYLLGRFCKIEAPGFTRFSRKIDAIIIASITFLMAITSFVCLYWGLEYFPDRIIGFASYINPLVILMSLYYVILFAKCRFRSKIINMVASHSFAVYLLHTHNSLFRLHFRPIIQSLYNSYNGISTLVYLSFFLISVFFISVVLDILRKIIWDGTMSMINKRV